MGSEAYHLSYYRIFYWWVGRATPVTAANYGYAPLSPSTASDARAETYQMEMYHQAALQAGEQGLRGRRVLEISCGLGGGLDHLKRRHGIGQATGLDRSTIAIRHAAKRFGLSTLAGDARSLPFADGSFDVVVNIEASHLYYGREFLGELARVLAPGGTVVMADFRYRAPPECERELRDDFAAVGFDVSQFRDITANVVAACEGDAPRREALLAAAPWLLRKLGRPWIGTETSVDYLDMRAGRAMCFMLAARRMST